MSRGEGWSKEGVARNFYGKVTKIQYPTGAGILPFHTTTYLGTYQAFIHKIPGNSFYFYRGVNLPIRKSDNLLHSCVVPWFQMCRFYFLSQNRFSRRGFCS